MKAKKVYEGFQRDGDLKKSLDVGKFGSKNIAKISQRDLYHYVSALKEKEEEGWDSFLYPPGYYSNYEEANFRNQRTHDIMGDLISSEIRSFDKSEWQEIVKCGKYVNETLAKIKQDGFIYAYDVYEDFDAIDVIFSKVPLPQLKNQL